jgi:hypothetical protein
LPKLHVAEISFVSAGASLLDHRRRHVDADDGSRRTDHPGGDDAVDAGAAANVDDALAQHQAAKPERVARARERSDRRFRHTIEPFLIVTDDCGESPAGMKVKITLRFLGD